MATIVCEKHRPQMSTVRPGVMEKATLDENRLGKVEKINFKLEEEDKKGISYRYNKEKRKKEVALEEANIIVSGWKRTRDKEGFKLLKELAR